MPLFEVNICNFDKSLHSAEVKNKDRIADALIDSHEVNTVDSRAPSFLLQTIIYVNAIDARGRTPLIVSIEHGRLFKF